MRLVIFDSLNCNNNLTIIYPNNIKKDILTTKIKVHSNKAESFNIY